MNMKKEFFKGVLGFTESDEELLAKKAEQSIYRWWWEFMRINPVFWYARTKGIEPTDPLVCEVLKLAGDLSHDNFYIWWNATGRGLFAEGKKIPEVTVINLQTIDKHPFKEKDSLYLDIPLTISRRKIIKEINKKLDKFHSSRSLDVAKHSTARMALYTKKYRLNTVENEYWVLLYRMLHSKISMWQIGDRLRINPSLNLREQKGWSQSKGFNRLNSLTGRYYYKARYVMNNMMFKEFPNYKKRDLNDNFMPFGPNYQDDFLKATKLVGDRREEIRKRKTKQELIDERNQIHSEFHQWLIDNYASSLKWEIVRRNNLESNFKMSKVWARLPDFISGISDQLF
jgi:hypothetical protein